MFRKAKTFKENADQVDFKDLVTSVRVPSKTDHVSLETRLSLDKFPELLIEKGIYTVNIKLIFVVDVLLNEFTKLLKFKHPIQSCSHSIMSFALENFISDSISNKSLL